MRILQRRTKLSQERFLTVVSVNHDQPERNQGQSRCDMFRSQCAFAEPEPARHAQSKREAWNEQEGGTPCIECLRSGAFTGKLGCAQGSRGSLFFLD